VHKLALCNKYATEPAQSLGSHDRLHAKFFKRGGAGKFYPRGPKELAKSLSLSLLTDLHTQAAVRASSRYKDTTSRLHSKTKITRNREDFNEIDLFCIQLSSEI